MAVFGDSNVSADVDEVRSRTFEEVDAVFKDAHVEPENLRPVYQSLWFAEKQPLENNLFLLELDKKLLNVLKEGQSLVFRGEKDERAVLCSDDKTFNLQVAEISNSLALVPDILWSEDANNSSGERAIQEKKVQPTYPKLRKLCHLLEPARYKGPDFEEIYRKNNVEFLSTRDLLQKVQASEVELLEALKENCACCINGHWRLLENDYHADVLLAFFSLVHEKGWGFDDVICEDTISSLENKYPRQILHHIFDCYCVKTGVSDDEGRDKWSIQGDRVCRFFGDALLKTSSRFNLQDFLDAWKDSIPEGLKVDLKYLTGLALIDENAKPPCIFSFPESDLPEDIEDRFKVLFKVQDKWTIDQIRPYIQRLTTERMNVNALLTKYAAGKTVDGVRYYLARYGR